MVALETHQLRAVPDTPVRPLGVALPCVATLYAAAAATCAEPGRGNERSEPLSEPTSSAPCAVACMGEKAVNGGGTLPGLVAIADDEKEPCRECARGGRELWLGCLEWPRATGAAGRPGGCRSAALLAGPASKSLSPKTSRDPQSVDCFGRNGYAAPATDRLGSM